jgi:hypothetical protein
MSLHQRPTNPDMTVEHHQALENADLREANRQLIDLVTDLAFRIHVAERFAQEQYEGRICLERRRDRAESA